MTVVLVRNWWALALRGALAVLFGVGAFVMPGLTMAFLIALFGAYALIDGVLAIVAGVKAAEHHERFGSLLLRGILGIAAGLVAFILPAATAVVLTLMIGPLAIVTGVLEIVAAVHLYRGPGEWVFIANGVVSGRFGLFFLLAPPLRVLSPVWAYRGLTLA